MSKECNMHRTNEKCIKKFRLETQMGDRSQDRHMEGRLRCDEAEWVHMGPL
jgi:hypothetical protein